LRATRAISSFRTEAILGMFDYFYWVLKRRLLPALPTCEISCEFTCYKADYGSEQPVHLNACRLRAS
jgi:hypothetical protein